MLGSMRKPAMQSSRRHIIRSDRLHLPLPSSTLDGTSLFLDIDGTLLELVDRPDEVSADAGLRDLLFALNERLAGCLAVVSGRSIDQIDAILGPIAKAIAVSGSHGVEHRWRGVEARPERPVSLDRAASQIRRFVDRLPGVLLEEKSFGIAIHYRMRPEAEDDARALAQELAEELELHLQPGKMMVELRVPGGDKGSAVHRLMSRAPMQGTAPIFVGDDWTDEPGFVAAQELGGYGILVGPLRETGADYRLASPGDLRAWLMEAIR
jgi:trehalose 6-phosphate phosphatase